LDTGCNNDSSSNATIKHEVKEEIILEENHVRSENNEDQRFVVFFYKDYSALKRNFAQYGTQDVSGN
jgi:GH18 family chitinase